MVVGILDHQTGTRDIRAAPAARPRLAVGRGRHGRWSARRRWPGVPLAARLRRQGSRPTTPCTHGAVRRRPRLVLGAVVVGSMLTVAYSARFYLGRVRRAAPSVRADARGRSPSAPPAAPWRFVAPAARARRGQRRARGRAGARRRLVGAGRESLDGDSHGGAPRRCGTARTCALALSVVTLAGGAAARRCATADAASSSRSARAIPSAQRRLPRACSAASNGRLDRVTGVVQNGSLPVYAGMILLTAAVAAR